MQRVGSPTRDKLRLRDRDTVISLGAPESPERLDGMGTRIIGGKPGRFGSWAAGCL